ncbi:hypothetical protein IL306_000944 [Fusarium sp. DS 682]|nr:hypothetical protein IL306_000944 [Fusarium sp. DS 682]
MEFIGLNFVINASRLLNLEAATMLDILRHASARSAVSMAKSVKQSEKDSTDMASSLASLVKLSSRLHYQSALMSSGLSLLEEWQAILPSPDDLEDSTNSSFLCANRLGTHELCASKRISVVGLGAMGLGMALSLKRSFFVVGCDVSPQRLDEAKSESLSVTSDVTSCVDEADSLLFVVETPQQISGIIRTISRQLVSRQRPLTIIVHTTMSSSSAMGLKEQVWQLNPNISYLEAPISGGPARAKRGELLMIVAGERAVLDDQLAVVQQMSSRIYYAGNVGNASKIKALHQVSAAINHVSSFEFTCLGLTCGIEGKVRSAPRTFYSLG